MGEQRPKDLSNGVRDAILGSGPLWQNRWTHIGRELTPPAISRPPSKKPFVR